MPGRPLTPSEGRVVESARHLIGVRADVANVAAVIRTADGETFAAVNVSNDVGGVCAEAAALARVLAEIYIAPEIMVAARLGAVVTPCGRCRQLISDRFPDMAVIVCMEGNLRRSRQPPRAARRDPPWGESWATRRSKRASTSWPPRMRAGWPSAWLSFPTGRRHPGDVLARLA